VNIYNSDGQLINSSGGWPLADVNIAGREYFGALKSNRELKLTLGEPVQSYFTGKPTTVIAHRLNGLGGVFLGYAVAGLRQAAGRRWARNLFLLSLIYLPLLFGALLLDRRV